MTEERKQELGQLLEEAMGSLVIRYGYRGPLSIPVDVYRGYLQERWRYYGADFFACSFSARFTPDITSETTRLKLLDFIREELVQYIKGDNILITACGIETDSTDKSCLYYHGVPWLDLYFLIERLLEIAIDRGIDEAVSVFDRRSCPDGTHDFFHDVALLDGIKIETPVQVFEGVRLIPSPSREISDEIGHELFGISYSTFSNQARSFFGKTLLVIDRPGFTIFWKTSEKAFQDGTDINELPCQGEVPNVKFVNSNEVDSFKTLFCYALSLVCNAPVRIFHERWFLAEDKSFNPHSEMSSVHRYRNPSSRSTTVKESDIEKAKCLYDILYTNLDMREKLRIPTDRWIQSKVSKMHVDKMIDLGIALEALYVTSHRKIGKRLRDHASWYLGKDNEDQAKLNKEFKEIYEWRSKAVHTGELPNKTKKTPFTPQEVKQFIERAQDLCRESIMKILEDGEFPDWNSLILGGEAEQANS